MEDVRMFDIIHKLLKNTDYNFDYNRNEHLLKIYIDDDKYISIDTSDEDMLDYVEYVIC